jgi:hypothetical protein
VKSTDDRLHLTKLDLDDLRECLEGIRAMGGFVRQDGNCFRMMRQGREVSAQSTDCESCLGAVGKLVKEVFGGCN